MADAGGAQADAGGAQADGPVGFFGGWTGILRLGIFYFALQQMSGSRTPPQSASSAGADAGELTQQPTGVSVAGVSVTGPGGSRMTVPQVRISNAWDSRQLFDLRVYTSEAREFDAFDDKSALLWHEPAITYSRDDKDEEIAHNFTIRPSARMLRNETGMWLHVYLTKIGTSPDPMSKGYDMLNAASAHHPLVKLVTRKVPKATRNLLSSDGSDGSDGAASGEVDDVSSSSSGGGGGDKVDSRGNLVPEAGSTEIVPHWKPKMILSIVEDFSVFPPGRVPPQLLPHLVVDVARGRYSPVVFINEFWCPRERMFALNETAGAALAELPLELEFTVTTLMRWMLTVQMLDSLEQQASMHGSVAMEEMHRMMTETSPWLLALTAVVTILHSIFDILAFKNDISFWRQKKSMKGLSFKSMLLNLFFQSVIFLYLCDNDTSWMILFSSGTGLAIECWKLRKAIKVIAFVTAEGSRLPSLRITPADSYEFSETRLYDEEAMAYLSMSLYPCVLGYAAYSLAYNAHKSWYSWLLGSTVNFVYSFGFVLMTPQLFINYKLKSTAHMPWKTFMYKALNTFVDDFFAFIIKMPMAHRLACLRDDVIFLIYLYQRYIYGVDEKRANEYGQVAGAHDDAPPPPPPLLDVDAPPPPPPIEEVIPALADEVAATKER